MKTAKNTTEDQLLRAVRPEKRNRSAKDRPETAAEVISAIDSARLDGRTSYAKSLASTRKALAERPLECALSLVRDQIAVNGTIASAIVREMSSPGFTLLDDSGNLCALLGKTWPDVQKNIMAATTTLLRLESILNPTVSARAGGKGGAEPGEGQPQDISSIILSLSND